MPEQSSPFSKNQPYALPRQASATRFWWIRHAPVSHLTHVMYGNQDVDADLSNDVQAPSLAQRLPQDAIWYTSHLKRTKQTANAVAQAGLRSREDLESPLIAEMDFGAEDTGKTHEQLLKERDDPYRGFWPVSPLVERAAGESMSDVRARLDKFVTDCIARHPRQDIICFSHMGAILAALANALQLPLHHSVSFAIDNLSLTHINHFADLHPQAPQFRVMKVSELHHAN